MPGMIRVSTGGKCLFARLGKDFGWSGQGGCDVKIDVLRLVKTSVAVFDDE